MDTSPTPTTINVINAPAKAPIIELTILFPIIASHLISNGGVERSPRNAEPLKAGQSEVDIRSNDLLGIFVSNSIIIEFNPVLLS